MERSKNFIALNNKTRETADSLEVGDVVEYLGQPWTVTETHGQDAYSFTTIESLIGGVDCSTMLNPQAIERLVRIIKKYFP